jgi:hypothetical protein
MSSGLVVSLEPISRDWYFSMVFSSVRVTSLEEAEEAEEAAEPVTIAGGGMVMDIGRFSDMIIGFAGLAYKSWKDD